MRDRSLSDKQVTWIEEDKLAEYEDYGYESAVDYYRRREQEYVILREQLEKEVLNESKQ